MRITVFGGTGATGRLVVSRTHDAGHDVTVLARTPSKLAVQHPRLAVLQGDVLDPVAVARAVSDAEAVLSCIGSPTTRPPITVYSEGTANIMAGMRQHGASRLVAVTSGALTRGRDPNYPLFFEWIIKPLVLRHVYDDMRRMEALVTASDLEWTLIRPSRLSDDAHDAPLREVPGAFSMDGGFWTSRDALARAIADKLDQPESIGQAIAVAN